MPFIVLISYQCKVYYFSIGPLKKQLKEAINSLADNLDQETRQVKYSIKEKKDLIVFARLFTKTDNSVLSRLLNYRTNSFKKNYFVFIVFFLGNPGGGDQCVQTK